MTAGIVERLRAIAKAVENIEPLAAHRAIFALREAANFIEAAPQRGTAPWASTVEEWNHGDGFAIEMRAAGLREAAKRVLHELSIYESDGEEPPTFAKDVELLARAALAGAEGPPPEPRPSSRPMSDFIDPSAPKVARSRKMP
jgi:hypothetical protein